MPIFNIDSTDIRVMDLPIDEASTDFSLMEALKRMRKAGIYSGTSTGKVLIVEDNLNNSKIMQDILNSGGVPSDVVNSAAEAIQYCRRETPMMILMDISLPDIDGIELTRQMRKQARLAGIPILAVSAHTADIMKGMAQNAGCDAFIEKPFRPAKFLAKVEEYLDPIA